jgi:hypothetical protein
MARKVRFKARRGKRSMEKAFWITLRQKRHDSEGNEIPGFTFDEICAMTREQREKVRQAGWRSEVQQA